MSNPQCCNNEFCRSLPEHLREGLCAHKTAVSVKRRRTFLLNHNEVLNIRTGTIIPSNTRPDGNEKGIKILSEGSMLGVAQIYTGLKTQFSVRVIEDLQGCIFDNRYLEEQCADSKEFSRAVIRQLAHHLTVCTHNMEDQALGTSTEKILSLLELTRSDTNKDITLTHEEIALLVGMNRVTVSRAIASMKEKGPIQGTR